MYEETVNRMKILFLEDNPLDSRRISGLLAKDSTDVDVDAVETLSDALSRLKQVQYDAILTDLNVPDSEGLDTFLKLQEWAPGMPIVILTGSYQDESNAVNAVHRGAQDFLTKDDLSGKILRRTLKYAIERKQMDNLRQSFVSIVTHELNTPISVIHGAVDNLKEGFLGALNEAQQKYLDMIGSNAKRLHRLSNDIHDLTKIEGGRFHLNVEEIDLCRPLRNVRESLEELSQQRGVRIEPNLPGPVRISADEERLEQVFTNVIKNAVRFADTRVEVRLDTDETRARVAVEDDGPGLDPVDLPMLFQPFYQGKQKKKSDGGSGLGLAIVRGIVMAHGGTIDASNRPDRRGARFVVTLPKSKGG